MPVAVIGAVIGAAAAWAAGATLMGILAAAALGMVVGMALFSKKPKVDTGFRSPSERKQTLRASAGSVCVCYGESYTGGLLAFAEEQPGQQDFDEDEELYCAVVICGHAIQDLKRIDLGDDAISEYGNKASYTFHNNDNQLDQMLKSKAPSWKSDMIGKGLAWCSFLLKFDMDKYPSGIPNFKFLVHGKNNLLDPRSNSRIYSNNAALVILDYLLTYVGVPLNEINIEEFKVAANICDENVLNGDGKYSRRYTIDGQFDVEESRLEVLNAMYQCCFGEHTYRGGKHGILVGAYYGPAIHTLKEEHVAGSIKIVAESSYKDKVNVITGTYVEPKQNYAEIDYPSVRAEEWIAEDGREFTNDMKFRFVLNPFTAQRLATMWLRRKRYGRTLEIPVNMAGYVFRPGMNIYVDLPTYGIIKREYKVVKWNFDLKKGVTLSLREDRSDFYLDTKGVIVDNGDLVNLPKPSVAQPQDLQFVVLELGEVIQGFLQWTNVGAVSYNIVNIFDSTGKMVYNIQVPGNRVNLNGLEQGNYRVNVFAVNNIGTRSVAAELVFDIQAPNKPYAIDVETGYFSLTIKPRSNNINGVVYDFWTSGKEPLRYTDTAFVETNATRLGQGQFWTQNKLEYLSTYYYYVRSTNIYGASEFVQVSGFVDTELNDFWDQLDDKWGSSHGAGIVIGRLDRLEQALAESAAHQDWQTQYSYKQDKNFYTAILRVDKTVIEQGKAFSQAMLKLETSTNEQLAAFDQKITTVVDEQLGAMSQKVDQMEAQFGQDIAQLKQEMTTVFDKDGTGYSQYNLNVGIRYKGQYYGAGQSVWANVDGTGKVTTGVSFVADSFAIVNDLNGVPQTVFYVEDGKVYLKDVIASKLKVEWAQIQNVKITNAQISGDIDSSNWINNSRGWIWKQNGEVQINGTGTNNARMRIVNDQILVWDEQGRLRVEIGRLS